MKYLQCETCEGADATEEVNITRGDAGGEYSVMYSVCPECKVDFWTSPFERRNADECPCGGLTHDDC